MSDYKTLRRLCSMGAKKFGRQRIFSNGAIYQWTCGDIFISFDEDASPSVTVLYFRGCLIRKHDDCTEPLKIVRKVMLLDELADI